MERLMQQVQEHPEYVFDYGKKLAKQYKNEVCLLCLEMIEGYSPDAKTRGQYKKVCSMINKMHGFGGIDEAYRVITDLKSKYPRRSAMIEELELLEIKLQKNRKQS